MPTVTLPERSLTATEDLIRYEVVSLGRMIEALRRAQTGKTRKLRAVADTEISVLGQARNRYIARLPEWAREEFKKK